MDSKRMSLGMPLEIIERGLLSSLLHQHNGLAIVVFCRLVPFYHPPRAPWDHGIGLFVGASLQEFAALEREHARSGQPRCIVSDRLSSRINALFDALFSSAVFDNVPLRRATIAAGADTCSNHCFGFFLRQK